jgi:hypothetical protein
MAVEAISCQIVKLSTRLRAHLSGFNGPLRLQMVSCHDFKIGIMWDGG